MALTFESCASESVARGGFGEAAIVNIVGAGCNAGEVPRPLSDADDGVVGNCNRCAS